MKQAKADPALLVLLAAIGLVGLLVTRRYGVVPVPANAMRWNRVRFHLIAFRSRLFKFRLLTALRR